MADTKRGSRPVTLIPPLSAQGLDRFAHFAIYHLPDGQLDVLGAGGMGTTYRAFDLQLDRPVALKVIHPQHFYHPDVRSRFLREAKATARLQHPNIAGILYQGEENGICFYAMELVSGEDLENYVQRVGPLDPVAALQICHQILLGLDAAYQIHLLHRDLKPANVMLTRYHDHRVPHVKVIDFGLAKFLHDMPATMVTRAGFMGTPGYASPEQCQELPLDCRSDLYSLGSTLWFLLSGTEPFEGSTLSIIQAHVYNEPDYSRLPLEPGPVHYVLQRLLAKKPEDRPETPMHAIHEVEYAIEALGGPAASIHHPVELKLPPPGPPPTILEPGKSADPELPKSRLYWFGGAGLLFLLLAGLLIFWVVSGGKNAEPAKVASAPNVPLPVSPVSKETEPAKVAVVPPAPSQEPVEKSPTASVPAVPEAAPSVPPPVSETSSPKGSLVSGTPAVPEPTPVAVAPPVVSSVAAPANSSFGENTFSAPAPVSVRPDATGEKINSLGMKFVPVPFLGGDNWVCVWKTRVKDYRAFTEETKRISPDLPSWKDPGFVQGDDHPVVCVSIEDADAFCRWLTQKEKEAGTIKSYQVYRVPTRIELEAFKGRLPPDIVTQLQQKYPNKVLPRFTPPEKYPWGGKWPPESGLGNLADEIAYRTGLVKRAVPGYKDGYPATSPVGSFPANASGLFDMVGNVWEMQSSPDGARISRDGGSWASYQESDFSSREGLGLGLKERSNTIGFRCVLVDQDLATAFHPPQANSQQWAPEIPPTNR